MLSRQNGCIDLIEISRGESSITEVAQMLFIAAITDIHAGGTLAKASNSTHQCQYNIIILLINYFIVEECVSISVNVGRLKRTSI